MQCARSVSGDKGVNPGTIADGGNRKGGINQSYESVRDGHDLKWRNGKKRRADETILLLDDRVFTRECLSLGLSSGDAGFAIIEESSVEGARTTLRSEAPVSVVVFNIGGRDVADDRIVSAIRELKESAGSRNLVLISEVEEAGSILKSLALGVHGYVTTRTPLGVALQAIRLVAAGGTFIPTAPLAELTHRPAAGGDLPAHALGPPHADAETVGQLTPRQHAVLKCLREGKSNKIIAYELGMCESTVKVHVRNVLRKLGASNRTQAAYLAFEQERLVVS